MNTQRLRRLLLLTLGTPVVMIPVIDTANGYRAWIWETYQSIFLACLIGLFLTSILFLRREYRWSCVGLVASILALIWSFAAPVNVE